MSTTRTIGSYLDQQTIKIVKNLEVRKFKAQIEAVLFGGHSFAVIAPGYTGPAEVPADPSINFGTQRRPLVFRGNDCWVEKDNTGRWHVTQYIATTRCTPVTPDNAPNVPLPVYTPPIDTSTLNFGGQNYVDLGFTPQGFNPINIPMGNFALAKMPITTLSSVYDIGDGYNGTISTGSSMNLLSFTTVRRFKIVAASAYCANAVTINVYATGGSIADFAIIHSSSGDWFIQIGLVTTSVGTGNSFAHAMPSAILVPSAGLWFHTQADAGSSDVTALGYGLGGSLY